MKIQLDGIGLGINPLLWQSEPLDPIYPNPIGHKANWALPMPLSQLHALQIDLFQVGAELAELRTPFSIGEYLQRTLRTDFGFPANLPLETSFGSVDRLPFHVALPLSELSADMARRELGFLQGLQEFSQTTHTRLQQLLSPGVLSQLPQDVPFVRGFEASKAPSALNRWGGSKNETSPEEHLQESRRSPQERGRILSQLRNRLRKLLSQLNPLRFLRR